MLWGRRRKGGWEGAVKQGGEKEKEKEREKGRKMEGEREKGGMDK